MLIILSQLLGGIGLLLYGIEIMKDSLELVTKGKGQRLIETTSKNRFACIFAGLFVTAVNQKSSATTIMVVGLVNAGMMSLVQATGVIIGANIGTTITAQLLAFRLEYAAPMIIGIGVIVWRFSKTKRTEYLAEIFLGFGMMFIGMIFMELGMKQFFVTENAVSYLLFFQEIDASKYALLILVGFALTFLAHSSSLSTGIMIAMSAQSLLMAEMIVPLILGVNIGKCAPALLSSRGLSRTAKRAAIIHLLFNLSGTVVVLLFLREIAFEFITGLSPDSLPHQVANAHTFFNAVTGLICLPFMNLLAKTSDRLIPAARGAAVIQESNLDVRLLETPGLALGQAYNQVIRLSKMAFDAYRKSYHSVMESDERDLEAIKQMEDILLKEERELEVYLVKLAQKKISKDQHEMLNLMLGVSSDIERICDLSINIAELAVYNMENRIHFSEAAQEEMAAYQNRILLNIEGISRALETKDVTTANSVLSADINTKNLVTQIREHHIERLAQGACNPGTGVLYMDIINSMEHVAEHIKKMGYFLIEVSKY